MGCHIGFQSGRTYWESFLDSISTMHLPEFFEVVEGTLFTVAVRPSPTPVPAVGLPTFIVNRPCYASDLRMAPVTERHTLEMINMHTGGMETTGSVWVEFDGIGKPYTRHPPSPPMARVPVGSIQQWRVIGLQEHPFHLHVYPHQIQHIAQTGYMRNGDWHDTIHGFGLRNRFGIFAYKGEALIRIAADTFTGKAITHCHILDHEDAGLMGFVNVYGVEGTQVQGLTNCYRDAFGAGYTLSDDISQQVYFQNETSINMYNILYLIIFLALLTNIAFMSFCWWKGKLHCVCCSKRDMAPIRAVGLPNPPIHPVTRANVSWQRIPNAV